MSFGTDRWTDGRMDGRTDTMTGDNILRRRWRPRVKIKIKHSSSGKRKMAAVGGFILLFRVLVAQSILYAVYTLVKWIFINDSIFGHGQISVPWLLKNDRNCLPNPLYMWWMHWLVSFQKLHDFWPCWSKLFLDWFVQNVQDLWKSGHVRTLRIVGEIGCRMHLLHPFFFYHVCCWPLVATKWYSYKMPRSRNMFAS